MMTLTPYKAEILSQPANLRNALENIDLTGLEDIRNKIKKGLFDRVVLTGMGASFYSLYPAWLYLSALEIPVIYIDLGELIHFARALVTPKTLLWVVSQSGRTAELKSILDKEQFNPAYLLATVNDVTSPLAQSADFILPIRAEVEKTVSTRTYLNSLMMNQLAVMYIKGEDIQEHRITYYKAAETLEKYLQPLEDRVEALITLVGLPEYLIFIGRGASMASAYMGALMMQEAAKFPAIAANAGQFRHGPLEMVDERVTALVLAGPSATRELNFHLTGDLLKYGTRAFWLADEKPANLPTITIPSIDEIALPIIEIAALQILSISIAELRGVEAGKFFRLGKITLEE